MASGGLSLGTAALVGCLLGVLRHARSLEDGLARTPPMGYNTWNDLQCTVDEAKVKGAAEALLEEGFQALGYNYINVDDCWMEAARGPDGNLKPRASFASGMGALGNFLHEKGFKFGLYTSRGSLSCSGLAGSLDHEAQDAKQFAAWGVDYLKNDGCYDTECFYGKDPRAWTCAAENRKSVLNKYRRMRDALNATGRHMLYEVCGWEPWYAPVGQEIGHMFRVGADVQRWADVYEATQLMSQLGNFSRPGGWVHPDMLLGSTAGTAFSLTPRQSRAQFSLWSVFPAPLVLGTRAGQMSEWDRQTYSNPEVIAVNQDPLGRPASRIFCNCGFYPLVRVAPDGYSKFSVIEQPTSLLETDMDFGKPFQDLAGKAADRRQCQQVWARPLHDGDLALVAVNFADTPAEVQLSQLSLAETWQAAQDAENEIRVRDLWRRRDLPATSARGHLEIQLPADGGHAMFRLSARPAPSAAAAPPLLRRERQGHGALEVGWQGEVDHSRAHEA